MARKRTTGNAGTAKTGPANAGSANAGSANAGPTKTGPAKAGPTNASSAAATPAPASRGGRAALEPDAARRRGAGRAIALVAAALVVLGLWAGMRLSAPQPWSYDEYYHLAVARELRAEPLLRSFPWTPHSVLSASWADKEPLFHFAIAPFARLPLERAGFLAALLGQALLVAAFAYALWRLRVPRGWLWLLALAGLGTMTTLRAEMARPHLWVITACFVGAALVLGRARPWVLGIAAALAGLAHAGGWLVPALALLWALLDRVRPGPGGPIAGAWRAPAAAGAGWLAGQLVHPGMPANFRLLWLQNVVIPLQSAGGDELLRSQLGTELAPAPAAVLVEQWPAYLAAVVLVALLLGGRRVATRDVLTVAVPALGFLVVGTFLMQRFFELGAPLTLLALGLVARERTGAREPRKAPALVAVAVLVIVVAIGWTCLRTLQLGFGLHSPPRAMAEWLGRNGNPGEKVFTAQWADSAPLLWSAPQLLSLVALDPTFFWAHDPQLFAAYVNIASGRHAEPAGAIRERFGSRWVAVWKPGYPQLTRRLLSSPGVRVGFEDADYAVFDLGR
jgi:hypothetical protein